MAHAESKRTILFVLAASITIGGLAIAARWSAGGGDLKGDAAIARATGGDTSTVPDAGDTEPVIVVVELETPASTIEVALLRTGIRPESLAAAGVNAPALGTLLQRTDQWFVSSPSLLAEADGAYAEARKRHDKLKRLVASGLGTDQDVIDLAVAKTSLASAESSRDAALDNLFAAATVELSGAQVATLSQIRANARWKFPVRFLVEEREQPTWVALRDALANERIAPQFGDEPDPGAQSLLSEFEGRQAVVQASSNLATYLASLEASWDASLH